jgi:hypothetical protein
MLMLRNGYQSPGRGTGCGLTATKTTSESLLEMNKTRALSAARRLLSYVSGLDSEHPDRQKANLRMICVMLKKYVNNGKIEGISDRVPSADVPDRITKYLGTHMHTSFKTESLDVGGASRSYSLGYSLLTILDALAHYIEPRNDGREHMKVTYGRSIDGRYTSLLLYGEKVCGQTFSAVEL